MFYIETKILGKENTKIAKETISSYDSTLAYTLADWIIWLHLRVKETICKIQRQTVGPPEVFPFLFQTVIGLGHLYMKKTNHSMKEFQR